MLTRGVAIVCATAIVGAGCTPTPAFVSSYPEAPAVISHRGSTSAGTGRPTDTLDIPRPTRVEKGDVLLARVANRDNVSATMTSWGWTQVNSVQSAGLLKSWIFVKVAEAVEPESYPFHIDASSPMAGSISAFSGVDRAHPVDVATGRVKGDSGTLAAAALITTGGNDLAVWFGTQLWAGSSCPDTSISPPRGFTQTISTCLRSKASGLVYGTAYRQLGAAGAQPPWTGKSPFTRTNITQAVALRPAVPKQVADHYAGTSVDVGTFKLRTKEELWEASGLATSRRNPNVAYVHSEGVYHSMVALDTTNAAVLGRFTVPIPRQYDWEDIATGPCPAGSCIFAGDIGVGKGSGRAPSTFAVYRVPEPDIAGQHAQGTLRGDLFRFTYPDGSHNAEALMVHPETGDIYIITKARDGRSGAYKFPNPLPTPSDTAVTTLVKVATLQIPIWDGDSANRHAATWYAQVTAAAIHPLSNRFLVRTPYMVYEYRGPAGGSFESAFQAKPTALTAPSNEGQGEAIDYAQDGSAYFTVGEQDKPSYTLKRVDRSE